MRSLGVVPPRCPATLVLAVAVVPAFSQSTDPNDLGQAIRLTRNQVHELSHRFVRTYNPGDGVVVKGLFAIDSRGNRRMDLGIAGSRTGESTSIYNVRGDFSSYDYEGGATGPRVTEASLHEARKGSGTGGGVLDACYEILGEPLDELVSRGKVVSQDGDTVTVVSTLGSKTKVALDLSRQNGYLCTRWSADQGDRSIVCESDAWRRFGPITLPTHVKIRVKQAGQPDEGHEDSIESVEVNQGTSTLLDLPKVPVGVLVKDNAAHVLYRVQSDGSLQKVGDIGHGGRKAGSSPTMMSFAAVFVASTSLALFMTLRGRGSRANGS